MKLGTISTLILLACGSLLYAEENKPLAVMVTCKTTNPKAKRKDFVALEASCDKKQEACDGYKDDPFYGPATATTCEPFYNEATLRTALIRQFKELNRRFPGSPGSVTVCKTKAEGNLFAMVGETCDPQEQAKNCDKYAKGIAEPASCGIYTSLDWIESETNKNPPRYGFECQVTGSAVPYRLAVPDCSDTLKKLLCPPDSAKILQCKKWDDPNALKQWAEAIPITAFVACRINDLPAKVIDHLPARDCSPQALADACGTWGTPAGVCQWADIEGMRQKLAAGQR